MLADCLPVAKHDHRYPLHSHVYVLVFNLSTTIYCPFSAEIYIVYTCWLTDTAQKYFIVLQILMSGDSFMRKHGVNML